MVNPTFVDYVDLLFTLFERFWQHDSAHPHRRHPFVYAHKALIVFFLCMHQRRLFRFKAQCRWLGQHPDLRTVFGLDAPGATGYDPLRNDAPELARTLAASVQQRIAFGERTGQRVRRIGAGFGAEGETPTLTGPRCASVHGFSLHANTQVPAHRRDQLERLIRYTARGAVSLERLAQDANGDFVSTFTRGPMAPRGLSPRRRSAPSGVRYCVRCSNCTAYPGAERALQRGPD